MLILEQLSLQTQKRAFTSSSKKLIKFQINNQLFHLNDPAKVKSQTLLEWNQPVTLPLHLMTQYKFEIYQQHRFGYNPQELSSVLSGKFTIQDDDNFNTWEVCTDRGNKIGFLSAKIRKKIKYEPKASIVAPEPQVLSISSIIAHISTLKQKRGYIVVSLEGKSFKTQITKSKSGELLFTQNMDIDKTDQLTSACVEVFEYNAKEEKGELLGSGLINLDPEHMEKKIIIRNQQEQQIGELFIDYKVIPKSTFAYGKQLARIIQQRPRMHSSLVEPTHSISATRTLNASSLYDSSLMHRPIKSNQRVSIVNPNTGIFTPTEPRFRYYQDKPSHVVSYLKDQTMDFKDKHSKVYYKGASIGKGDKYNFTKATGSNPGVGGYRLPSIWDRY